MLDAIADHKLEHATAYQLRETFLKAVRDHYATLSDEEIKRIYRNILGKEWTS